jgi:hypothetical protein
MSTQIFCLITRIFLLVCLVTKKQNMYVLNIMIFQIDYFFIDSYFNIKENSSLISNRHVNRFLIKRNLFGDFLDHTGLIRDLVVAF